MQQRQGWLADCSCHCQIFSVYGGNRQFKGRPKTWFIYTLSWQHPSPSLLSAGAPAQALNGVPGSPLHVYLRFYVAASAGIWGRGLGEGSLGVNGNQDVQLPLLPL